MSKVTFHDTVSVDVAGTLPAKGSKAPAFSLVNAELGESTLATYAGKRKVLNIFPSVDTGVCATSVRRFNTEASKLDNTVVLTARAVVVLDENDQVLHSELVSELTHEPDYAAALAVL